MESINRRTALTVGLTVAAMPLVPGSASAVPKAYGPNDGEELLLAFGWSNWVRGNPILPPIRPWNWWILCTNRARPTLLEVMEADMVCTTIVGELEVTAGEQKFTAKEGDVWACGKGSTKEAATNNGTEAAVMRVIMIHA